MFPKDLISYLLKHYERSVPAQVRIAEMLEKAAQSQKADLVNRLR